MNEDLVYRLKKRAEIRRQISGRKSVQEGKPDRIAELLDEAAQALEKREWVGLTDEDLRELGFSARPRWWPMLEAKFKEKNT